MEDTTETVVFRSFYEKGFTLPVGAFFCGLLHFNELEVTHRKPNSIAQLTIFIHLSEGYFGDRPPTSTYGGLCTTSRGTRSTFNGIWWVGPPSLCTRGAYAPTSSSATPIMAGRGTGSWFRTRHPVSRQSCARIQGVLGGATHRRGDGPGGVPPRGDCQVDRGCGSPVLLEAAHAVDTGEGPPGLRLQGRPHHGGANLRQGLPESPLLEAASHCCKFS